MGSLTKQPRWNIGILAEYYRQKRALSRVRTLFGVPPSGGPFGVPPSGGLFGVPPLGGPFGVPPSGSLFGVPPLGGVFEKSLD
ncbi:MAG: hypothetical protein FJ279_37015 [Planctomycetes bacterium]|nr:hypothetical protein [Planctomycetota bacterium]